jgi:hypothetical protein
MFFSLVWLYTRYKLDIGFIDHLFIPLGTTIYRHTQTSVLSLIQSPLAVSLQRLLPREVLQLPTLRSSCHSRQCSTPVNRKLTICVPDWWPFHTNLLVFSSQAHFQLTIEFRHSQTNFLSHFTSLNCWQLTAARLVYMLYNLEAYPTENTASFNPSIVVMEVA